MQSRFILFAVLAMLMFASACSDKPVPPGSAGSVRSDTHTGVEHAQSAPPEHELTLNNGAKWQSDASTRRRVAALESLIQTFGNNRAPELPAYHSLAQKAREEIDALIAGCRMEGAPHDALHLWLEPVMADVKSLQEAGTVDEASAISRQLSENVHKFKQYFQ